MYAEDALKTWALSSCIFSFVIKNMNKPANKSISAPGDLSAIKIVTPAAIRKILTYLKVVNIIGITNVRESSQKDKFALHLIGQIHKARQI